MDLSTGIENGLKIISVKDARIDAAVAIEFKDAMRSATADGMPVVILDLGAVQFIDSSGLGAIVAAMKQMGPGRTLALAGLTTTVEKVFRLTRMDSVFKVFQTLDAAKVDLAPENTTLG